MEGQTAAVLDEELTLDIDFGIILDEYLQPTDTIDQRKSWILLQQMILDRLRDELPDCPVQIRTVCNRGSWMVCRSATGHTRKAIRIAFIVSKILERGFWVWPERKR